MYQIDKIVLSSDQESCVVYLINGPNMNFRFSDFGMDYITGLSWIQSYLKFNSKIAA